jgi:hypothetical protein
MWMKSNTMDYVAVGVDGALVVLRCCCALCDDVL